MIFDDSSINKKSEEENNNNSEIIEKKNNDLISNEDINIEDKSKYKNEKEKLKNFMNYEINNSNQIEKFKIPPNLKKTFIVTIILASLGIILIILGFINAIADATPGGGIMFWILGGIVIIPGGYYSYQFYKAKNTNDEYKRQNILDNIPEL